MATNAELAALTRRALYTLTAGFIVSLYGLYVEIRFESDPDYVAFCDITSYISCTKALGSEYGKGFGVIGEWMGEESILNQKNALFGVIGYALLALVQLFPPFYSIYISLAAAVVLNMSTVYLFIVLFKLNIICLVCYSIYAVNFVFLITTLKRKDAYWRSFVKKD